MSLKQDVQIEQQILAELHRIRKQRPHPALQLYKYVNIHVLSRCVWIVLALEEEDTRLFDWDATTEDARIEITNVLDDEESIAQKSTRPHSVCDPDQSVWSVSMSNTKIEGVFTLEQAIETIEKVLCAKVH